MDTQTPYKTKHPTTMYGYGRKSFLPITKRSEQAKRANSIFSDKTKTTINFLWVPGELSKSQTRNQRRTTTLVIPSSVRPLAADKKYFVLHLRKPSP